MTGWLKKLWKGSTDQNSQALANFENELCRLGLGDSEEIYRNRLKRLYDFICKLGPGLAEEPACDFDRYERNLDPKPLSTQERVADIQRLQDLRKALQPLLRSNGEDAQKYLARLRTWNPLQELATVPEESPESCENRRMAVEEVLKVLGLDPPSAQAKPLDNLRRLQATLPQALHGTTDLRGLAKLRRWEECVEDSTSDWEWAYLQVLVRLAEQFRQEPPSSDQFCERMQSAEESLRSAIPKMESQGFLQHRKQGLYGALAKIYLEHARHLTIAPEDKLGLIERAYTYARHAVELEPASIRERLALLEALSAMQDAGELAVQAEIALNFDSGPDTLRTIGSSYWARVATASGKEARLGLLREAVSFFRTALQEVESSPFDKDGPLDQVQAHGWAHFWLGRFQCEQGSFDEAISHLQTAAALGFKPLESRVELAWTCYLARNRKVADEAFRAAIKEVDSQRAQRPPVACAPLVSRAPGEERKITELEFDAYLGWAFLCIDWDPNQALQKAQKATALLGSLKRSNPQELKAAMSEVRGRIHVRKGNLAAGILELEETVQQSARAGAYCALGLARLAQVSQSQPSSRLAQEAMRSAREACRLAQESDLRGRHTREISELQCQLQKFEPTSGDGATAPKPPAPVGAAPGKVPGVAQPAPGANGGHP